jgi:hypothetical protein
MVLSWYLLVEPCVLIICTMRVTRLQQPINRLFGGLDYNEKDLNRTLSPGYLQPSRWEITAGAAALPRNLAHFVPTIPVVDGGRD